MLASIRDYFDRRAVMRKLPPVLLERYGAKAHYSDGQVMKALEIAGVNARALAYAAVVFMPRAEAVTLLEHESVYTRARKAIADHYYEGDINFTVDLRGPLATRDPVQKAVANAAESGS